MTCDAETLETGVQSIFRVRIAYFRPADVTLRRGDSGTVSNARDTGVSSYHGTLVIRDHAGPRESRSHTGCHAAGIKLLPVQSPWFAPFHTIPAQIACMTPQASQAVEPATMPQIGVRIASINNCTANIVELIAASVRLR